MGDTYKKGVQQRRNFEAKLFRDHGIARGVSLESLGHQGADYDRPKSVADFIRIDRRVSSKYPEARNSVDDRGYREARLLRGAIAWGGRNLVDGLFRDILTLRSMKRGRPRASVIAECEILSQLPEGYAHLYTPEFAQQFLTITIDMTTRMTTRWEGPSCTAQEFAIHLLVKQIGDLVKEYGPHLDDDWSGNMYQGLLYDTDFMALYTAGPTSDILADWFEPFSGDEAVPPYAHFAPNDGPRTPRYPKCAPGEGLAPDRMTDFGNDRLMEIQHLAEGVGFDGVVEELGGAGLAISKRALEELCGKHRVTGVKGSEAVRAALREAIIAALDDPNSERVVFEAVPIDAPIVPSTVRLILRIDEVSGYEHVECLTLELANP